MSQVKVSNDTSVVVDTSLLTKEVVSAFLNDAQVKYLQSIQWFVTFPGVIARAKANPTDPEDKETIEKEVSRLKNLPDMASKSEAEIIETAIKNLNSRKTMEEENVKKLLKQKEDSEPVVKELENTIKFFQNIQNNM